MTGHCQKRVSMDTDTVVLIKSLDHGMTEEKLTSVETSKYCVKNRQKLLMTSSKVSSDLLVELCMYAIKVFLNYPGLTNKFDTSGNVQK